MKHLKGTIMILAALLALAGAVTGYLREGSRDADPSRLGIATGGTSGVYFPLGGALAIIINEKVEGVSATAESTGASLENVNLLGNGDVDFALLQNDIAYYGHGGLEMFEALGPREGIRGIATFYPELVQIVVNTSAGIETVEDLRGHRVAVGAPGSGAEANARQILLAHGLTYGDIQADFLSFAEASDGLKDGHVQAAFLTAGIPTAAVTDLSTTHSIRILSLNPSAVERLMAQYPFYKEETIPAGAYRNQEEAVTTVAVMAMLAVRASMGEEAVYRVTKALFENLDFMAAAHGRGADIRLETALEGVSIPLHEGAKRYFDAAR